MNEYEVRKLEILEGIYGQLKLISRNLEITAKMTVRSEIRRGALNCISANRVNKWIDKYLN